MTIGDISKKYDLSCDTLRYYEKIGLLRNVKRVNGKRDYSSLNEKDLNFILCMKNAGFDLESIIKFLNLYELGDDTLDERISMLFRQREKLVDKIKEKEKIMEFLNYKINYYEGKRNVK